MKDRRLWRRLTWLGVVLLSVTLVAALAPITANAGLVGEPKGDGGTVWCGTLWWRTSDCPGCCDYAGVYGQRLWIVAGLAALGLALVAVGLIVQLAAQRRQPDPSSAPSSAHE